jgi:hypothetical protein
MPDENSDLLIPNTIDTTPTIPGPLSSTRGTPAMNQDSLITPAILMLNSYFFTLALVYNNCGTSHPRQPENHNDDTQPEIEYRKGGQHADAACCVTITAI